ncbi:deoxycytidylate deaminase [Tissierella creatinophila]|uniref:tRNA-specific adenosine deaminase n=1 Tax=Tissierella creatinophila DSM 6911 TaxID=1123403 RepID=A0A1U7M755_TISCR|nr:deaminase [Tissierella creatinophila]OLS03028.1 tRNA-specific adenosine deaminase [Tissierella creatinophila DSM 6911]
MSNRKSWKEYFMEITNLVATRSTCDRALVGCLLVNDDNRIVSTGYNGSVKKNPHCDDIGHKIRDSHCIATIHAEINALLYCAKEGISVKDCTAYVTHFPCLNCTKALIQAGIKKIYFQNDYRVDEYAMELLNINGINIEKLSLK